MDNKIKKYKLSYHISIVLGLLGLLEIGTRSLFENGDFGVIIYVLGGTLNTILPSSIATPLTTIASLIFSFTLVFLIYAFVMHSRIKKMAAQKTNT